MTERLCTYHETDLDARGKPTPEYVRLYKSWGEGKIGIIVLVSVQELISLPIRSLGSLSHLLEGLVVKFLS